MAWTAACLLASLEITMLAGQVEGVYCSDVLLLELSFSHDLSHE